MSQIGIVQEGPGEARVAAAPTTVQTLRALGYEVVRVTWDDLAHPERVVGRIRAAMARGRRRHTPSA